MKALLATIRLTLDPDVVQNAIDNEMSNQDIIREVKEHLDTAVGNRRHINAGYILEAEILEINEEN